MRKTLSFWLLLLMLAGCHHEVRETVGLTKEPTAIPEASFPLRERARYESRGRKYMIASQGDATTEAARRMFARGGNIFDAAAAASFTLGVERPQSTGIGGGGFLLFYQAKTHKAVAVDFREKAPRAASQNMFLDANGELVKGASTEGSRAVAVPGLVAGILDLHRRYGKLSRATVLTPAIELAENGYPVYPHLARAIEVRKASLLKSEEARATFFKDGRPLVVGETLRQPALAMTLRTIAKKGKAGFYAGWVADAFLKEQRRLGGLVTEADLRSYEVKYREPVHGHYGGYDIISMPPPSSGGVHVVEILNILDGFPLAAEGPYSVKALHQTISAMQLSFRDRAKYLGDSDFVKVPTKGLTSEAYADALRAQIGPRAKHFQDVAAPSPFSYDSKDTAQFTIADSEGNLASATQTINGWFGSGNVVPKAGFVMNNEMDDFSAKPGAPNMFGVIGGHENAIAPGKRPLSSMSPTVVLRDGRPVLALGSPSGSQIISCVTLTLLNYLTYQMPLYEAVTALRYHQQWTPDTVVVEAPGFPEPQEKALEKLGYQVKTSDIGCKVEAVALENGMLHGVSDPRGEGLAAGEAPVPRAAIPSEGPSPHVSPD